MDLFLQVNICILFEMSSHFYLEAVSSIDRAEPVVNIQSQYASSLLCITSTKGADNDATDLQSQHLSCPQRVLEGLVYYAPFPEQHLIRFILTLLHISLNG